MRRRHPWLRVWLVALLIAAAAGVGLVGGRGSALVDWRDVRGVVFESDDWGLCGFFPGPDAVAGFDPRTIEPGAFPDVYWGSTLEDSAAVAALAAVLAEGRGADGLPAIWQPNYILSSLSWEPGAAGWRWVARDLPDLPPAYARPGLWTAVAQASDQGVWHPELHGRWHYDPQRREAASLRTSAATEAARRQILLFPGSEQAYELGPWRTTDDLRRELDASLGIFASTFGRRARAVIAPDYRWDGRCERLWLARDLATIQAKRGQRREQFEGLRGRAWKVVTRTFERLARRDRTYLERNCLFEPMQHPDPAAVTQAGVQAVAAAWRRGEPAIVESHRVNFAHLQPRVAEEGRRQLVDFLSAVQRMPLGAPIYMVDSEVAGLMRHGTSWCERGSTRAVVRNYSRSRRLVVAPPGSSNVGTTYWLDAQSTKFVLQ